MEAKNRDVHLLTEQVKDLQHQLALANRNHIEFSLAPPQKPRKSLEWVGAHDWPVEERKKILESLSFFPYELESDENKLLQLCYDMVANLGLIEAFNIPKQKLQNFFLLLKDSYRKVPFHNFFHAFNVAQSVYFFIKCCEAEKQLTKLEMLSLLISAFCHDVDHPGLNNTFLCNASTSLALLYNDFSVLEQHHCNECFVLLRNPNANILCNLDMEQHKLARKYIIACILSTDLAVHGEFMAKLQAKNNAGIKWDNFEDKKLVLCCLLKCADISNEIRPAQIGKNWAERVMTEFFAQSALEREKGMPVAPHMDPEQTNTASGQIGFISYLAIPLFSELVKVFPKMQVCTDQMNENRENWRGIEAKQKK